jgi:hypothetical protein
MFCGGEVFIPLAHPPGHAQVDFGEAADVERYDALHGKAVRHAS